MRGARGAEEIFWPKLTCAEGTRKKFCVLLRLEKNLPNHLRGRGVVGGGGPGGKGGQTPCVTPCPVVVTPPHPPPTPVGSGRHFSGRLI